MNQTHPKSQTTPRLYQHPAAEEMRPSFLKSAFSMLQNVSLIVIVGSAFAFTSLMILRGCADDVDRQHAMAVKHQLQYSNLPLGEK